MFSRILRMSCAEVRTLQAKLDPHNSPILDVPRSSIPDLKRVLWAVLYGPCLMAEEDFHPVIGEEYSDAVVLYKTLALACKTAKN